MNSFEHLGIWWLPEEPEQRLAGVLSFDPANGGKLTLIAKLPVDKGLGSNVKLSQEFPIIHGQMEGSRVTLKNCRVIQSGWKGGGVFDTKTFTIFIKTIFKGHHFENTNDITFQHISVRYTHLDKWMSQQTFECSKSYYKVCPIPFNPVAIKLGNNLKICFYYKPNRKWDLTEILFQDIAYIDIIPNNEMSYDIGENRDDNYFQYINHHLRDFLTLATGEPNYPLDITGIITEEGKKQEISIYYRIPDYDPRATSRLEKWFTFGFSFVEEDFPKYLSAWIKTSKELQLVRDLYFMHYYRRTFNRNLLFLFLVQALEAYHRHRICNNRRCTLKKRLNKICDKILNGNSDIIEDLIREPRKDFISKVVKTRNHLTHHPKDRDDGVLSSAELPEYIRKMRILMRLCFLVEVGLQPDDFKALRKAYPEKLS